MTRFQRYPWARAAGLAVTAVTSTVAMTAWGCAPAPDRGDARAAEARPIGTHAVALQIEGMT